MDRQIAPTYHQADHLELIFPEKITFNNGVELYWIKDVKDESVRLDIEWTAGSKYQNDKLVASFTSKLLLAGTSQKTSQQISEEIDFFGGYVSKSLDKDHSAVTLYGLTENITEIWKLFIDAFDGAVFPESELEKERAVALNQYKVDMQKVKTICRREFNRALFGAETPYGMVADEEDYAKVNRSQLEDFYNIFYRNTRPTFFLVGNVDDTLINALRDWSNGFASSESDSVNSFSSQKTGVYHTDKEALQSAIRIGRQLFRKDHPDYFNFQVLNTILGGYFGSRLMANIREDKGYSYGIGSGIAVMEDAGYFFIATEVGSQHRQATIDEVFFEIDRLKNEPIGQDELKKVQNYLLGDFLRQSDGPIAMMDSFKNIYYNKLPSTYYNDFISAIKDCTPEELSRLAKEYLKKEDLLIVSAGG